MWITARGPGIYTTCCVQDCETFCRSSRDLSRRGTRTPLEKLQATVVLIAAILARTVEVRRVYTVLTRTFSDI